MVGADGQENFESIYLSIFSVSKDPKIHNQYIELKKLKNENI